LDNRRVVAEAGGKRRSRLPSAITMDTAAHSGYQAVGLPERALPGDSSAAAGQIPADLGRMPPLGRGRRQVLPTADGSAM